MGKETRRSSRALEQFFLDVRGSTGLSILDLGGVNQENVSFITNLGHWVYAADCLRSLDAVQSRADNPDSLHPAEIEQYIEQSFPYAESFFDGVLLWDTLTFFEPRLAAAAVERLARMVRPKSLMLSLFHAAERQETVPACSFRIIGTNTLHVQTRGMRRPAQALNNRAVERLFADFDSVKFFLTRDSLREVLVRR